MSQAGVPAPQSRRRPYLWSRRSRVRVPSLTLRAANLRIAASSGGSRAEHASPPSSLHCSVFAPEGERPRSLTVRSRELGDFRPCVCPDCSRAASSRARGLVRPDLRASTRQPGRLPERSLADGLAVLDYLHRHAATALFGIWTCSMASPAASSFSCPDASTATSSGILISITPFTQRSPMGADVAGLSGFLTQARRLGGPADRGVGSSCCSFGVDGRPPGRCRRYGPL